MKCFPCIDAGGYWKYGYKIGRKIHLGDDYNCPEGTTVHSIAEGKVVYSGEVNGFGSYGGQGGAVIIEHRNKFGKKFLALYGHINRKVTVNDKVEKGQIIGTIIRYERKTYRADHLHFGINTHAKEIPHYPWGYDVQTNGWTDPMKYIFEKLS